MQTNTVDRLGFIGVLLMLLMAVIMTISGCAVANVSDDSRVATTIPEFQVLVFERGPTAVDQGSVPVMSVIKHKPTGRCFLFVTSAHGGGSLMEVTAKTALINSGSMTMTFDSGVMKGASQAPEAHMIAIEGQDMCHELTDIERARQTIK